MFGSWNTTDSAGTFLNSSDVLLYVVVVVVIVLWQNDNATAYVSILVPVPVLPATDARPQGWNIFSAAAYNRPAFDVTWAPKTAALGALFWYGGAVWAGLVLAGGLSFTVNINLGSFDSASVALQNLTAEVISLAALAAVLQRFNRRRPLNLSFRGAFAAPHGWAVWGLLGVATFPFLWCLNLLLQVSYLYLTSTLSAPPATFASVLKNQTITDTHTFIFILLRSAVLVPITEEVIFRGLLLAVLTTCMPVWAAILASSTIFGLVHFSFRKLPVLISCGCVFGASYVRSRNLLTPILIHMAFNALNLGALHWSAMAAAELS